MNPSVQPASGPALPPWTGQKIVEIRLELSDGTVDIIQLSTDFARVFAKELIAYCNAA